MNINRNYSIFFTSKVFYVSLVKYEYYIYVIYLIYEAIYVNSYICVCTNILYSILYSIFSILYYTPLIYIYILLLLLLFCYFGGTFYE